jgi:glucose-6-phosphate 1-epimerase
MPSGDVEAIFSLMDNEFTRSMWSYPYAMIFNLFLCKFSEYFNCTFLLIPCFNFEFRFRLTYRLILREKELHFNIGIYNPSKDLTFSFNLLLHTYFKVPDVRRCQITGLHGCTFIDKVCSFKSVKIKFENLIVF